MPVAVSDTGDPIVADARSGRSNWIDVGVTGSIGPFDTDAWSWNVIVCGFVPSRVTVAWGGTNCRPVARTVAEDPSSPVTNLPGMLASGWPPPPPPASPPAAGACASGALPHAPATAATDTAPARTLHPRRRRARIRAPGKKNRIRIKLQ